MNKIFERAALSKGNVEIIYLSESQEISHRIVKVLSFSNAVIKAYCYQKQCFRVFKLENVLSAKPVLFNRRTS